ncbi:CDP-glucose 4,6-dehydratase [Micropruina glycogenica]|uniref:CDP-glucose 4,6-dehydratase n=1 Tax=Micropruina glycogenica TaxID=75385 RepID=A0A2N9JAB9_9ACTN|nr:CDP-glucose 4,6-dehydratase [Micropruina glycogenica]SPD85127.1 CDP-glucose 4,6-dehydratase [Micropruina glycogenica]
MRASYWRGRRVFVTGHTGFKGAWLCLLLARLGAETHGYALETPQHFLFHRARVAEVLSRDVRGDVRDQDKLQWAMRTCDPDIVLHLAAQTTVREGYASPRETFSVNVDGTVTVLDVTRSIENVKSCVVVTTDKVYRNNEWQWAYRETDTLGGDDPYSASKAAAELATYSFAVSFPRTGYAVATARAGNVIGGGDATPDALIPEVVTSMAEGREAMLRYPQATRPWQHVLEPLSGYLTLAEQLGPNLNATAWNFGPTADDVLTVAEVTERLGEHWGGGRWRSTGEAGPHEAGLLSVDSALARHELGWRPLLDVDEAIAWVANWESAVRGGKTPREVTEGQIAEYVARRAHDS